MILRQRVVGVIFIYNIIEGPPASNYTNISRKSIDDVHVSFGREVIYLNLWSTRSEDYI